MRVMYESKYPPVKGTTRLSSCDLSKVSESQSGGRDVTRMVMTPEHTFDMLHRGWFSFSAAGRHCSK